jgi:hypothetical protein
MTLNKSAPSVNITLTKDLQSEFTAYLDCCYSLGQDPNVCKFLYYTYNYGTFENPRNPDDNDPVDG